jgi:hypothetical protein
MTPGERVTLIARYASGYGTLMAALDGLAAPELDWRPSPEAWTIRDVVHHLEDAELHGAVRLRRLLTEDGPAIGAYDEEVYRTRLDYAGRPVEPALEAIRGAHRTTAELLERLTEDDCARTGTHSEEGPYGVAHWLAFYAAHTHEHATQIREIRRAFAGGAAPAPAKGRSAAALR